MPRPAKTEIQERINAFKASLRAFDATTVTRRHVVFGECATISEDEYFSLRSAVADRFNLHPNEVVVVGSGKLGFSINPKKRYQHFGDGSDIDVTIISRSLFDAIWRELHRFEDEGGLVWGRAIDFKKYLFRGWIRPDFFPTETTYGFPKDWWKFFEDLSASRQFGFEKIRGAIYRDWYFLESYQRRAVQGCLDELSNGSTTRDED